MSEKLISFFKKNGGPEFTVVFFALAFGYVTGFIGWLIFNLSVFWHGYSEYSVPYTMLMTRIMLLEANDDQRPYAPIINKNLSRLPMCTLSEIKQDSASMYGKCTVIYSGNREYCRNIIGFDPNCRSVRISSEIWGNAFFKKKFSNNVMRMCESAVDYTRINVSKNPTYGALRNDKSAIDYRVNANEKMLQKNGCQGFFTEKIDIVYVEIFDGVMGRKIPDVKVIKILKIDKNGVQDVELM